MSDSDRPNVLILGGLSTFSRHLASFLVPEEGDRSVNHLRIVDKYSVAPPTTYIGPQFPRILAKPLVEYIQTNLTIPTMVQAAFEPKEGQAPFDYVFDLTGEVRTERLEEIHIEHTFNLSRLCGLEAARRKVKAYVRLQQPCYDSPEKGIREEHEHQKPAKPWGRWWHETLRALASIDDLNLVILRVGLGYGPWLTYGYVTPSIVIGRVYKHTKDKMNYLWTASTPVHVAHVDDISNGLWKCAKWVAQIGRNKANEVAGEDIWFAHEKSIVSGINGTVDPTRKLIAPLFNLVDDSDLTQELLVGTISKFFDIEYGALSTIMSTWAKLNQKDFIETANEHHSKAWAEIITQSSPPVPNTPLSPYLVASMFNKQGTAYSNAKIKNVLNLELRHPKFTTTEVGDIIESFKVEGVWPN